MHSEVKKDVRIIELDGVPEEIVNDPTVLDRNALEIANRLGLTIVRILDREDFPEFTFTDGRLIRGCTGGIMLAESHYMYHSWPERFNLTLDIFSCSSRVDLDAAEPLVAELYRPDSLVSTKIIPGQKYPIPSPTIR